MTWSDPPSPLPTGTIGELECYRQMQLYLIVMCFWLHRREVVVSSNGAMIILHQLVFKLVLPRSTSTWMTPATKALVQEPDHPASNVARKAIGQKIVACLRLILLLHLEQVLVHLVLVTNVVSQGIGQGTALLVNIRMFPSNTNRFMLLVFLGSLCCSLTSYYESGYFAFG